jgi:undecaprenyl diphosphate synthase
MTVPTLHPAPAANPPGPNRPDPANNPSSRDTQTATSLTTLSLPADALPRHVAVIMDGNGRWAQDRGKLRIFGHQQGAKVVRSIVTECANLGLEVLTLYSFSTENWKRPADEVEFLMDLYIHYLIAERRELNDNNIRFIQLGRQSGLPARVLVELNATVQSTAANTGLTLALALNYGSRAEITDAVKTIASKVQSGELNPDSIDEQTISAHLYTAGLPDPDLLIRTAGEMRVSNYLLWQISYAEIYVTDVLWPDFTVGELHKAFHAFAARQRKFGDVPS